jgi:beta-phosphoglucomutase-like phosphatase (HAD superfamily)
MFDLDGVLVDACEIHFNAFNKALGFNLTREEHLMIYNGLSTKKKLQMLLNEGKIKAEDIDKIWKLKQEYTEEEICKLTIDPIKVTMHMMLRDRNIESVCVTNSIRDTASLMLRKTGQAQFINLIVSNEDTERNKPFPDPYFFALERLNLMPHEILIVEDSDIGYTAAGQVTTNILKVRDSYDVDAKTVLKAIKEFEL